MSIYISAFLILVLVLVGHILGINGLYLAWAPYDIFMHIAGGIGIGLFLSAAVKVHISRLKHARTWIVIGVFIAGILWELFEIRYNLAGYAFGTVPYYLDTAKDLVDDVVGGIIVALAIF